MNANGYLMCNAISKSGINHHIVPSPDVTKGALGAAAHLHYLGRQVA